MYRSSLNNIRVGTLSCAKGDAKGEDPSKRSLYPHLFCVKQEPLLIPGGNSCTEGSESSHMHSKDDMSCSRGYLRVTVDEGGKETQSRHYSVRPALGVPELARYSGKSERLNE